MSSFVYVLTIEVRPKSKKLREYQFFLEFGHFDGLVHFYLRHKPPVFFCCSNSKTRHGNVDARDHKGFFSPALLEFPDWNYATLSNIDVQGGLLLGASEDKNVPKHALSSK